MPNELTKHLCYSQFQGNELYHHGILGMHWGVKNGPPYPLSAEVNKAVKKHNEQVRSVRDLQRTMQSIRYDDYKGLKSPSQLIRDKAGECHSQTLYEIQQLRKLGKNANGMFFIEYNPDTNKGGTTHSFAWFKENGKVVWFENAWDTQKGLHYYNNKSEMIADVKRKHFAEQKDKQYSQIEFGVFRPEDHKIGESLQDLVDICLR